MDIGASDDSDYEASERGSSEGVGDIEPQLPKNVDVETIQSPRSSASKDAQTAKWLRLRKHHIPKYLNLFRESWEVIADEESSSGIKSSQIGAVTWHSNEKDRLFTALARYGNRELKLLAEAVETKGELEIHAYLSILRHGDLERQLFHRDTQNATQIDMPAAIEIGDDVDSALERAADALSAYQEQYDYAIAARASEQEYVIDSEVAAALDAKVDVNEHTGEDSTKDRVQETSHEPHELFRIGHFCELSSTLFMKGSGEDPTNNWMNIAEAGESPSVTRDVVSDLSDLVLSLSRRIIQTTIFVTESRLKATTTKYWKPSSHVRLEDVESALDILNMKQSLFDYWLKFPRRRGLKVISGSHRKGASKKEYLTMDEAEARLSMPFVRGRHSRSSSCAAKRDTSESTDARSEASLSDAMSVDPEASDPGSDQSDDHQVQDSASESNDNEDIESDDAEDVPAPISRSKRKRLLEEEQDKYMEELDQTSRHAEEQRLVSELELQHIDLVKEEADMPPRKRPKVLRRTAEDVNGWNAPYLSVWEAYNLQPSEEADVESIEEPFTEKISEQPGLSAVDANSDGDEDQQHVESEEALSMDDEE